MLSLEKQTNVLSNEKGGYFFWDAFMEVRKVISQRRPMEHWSQGDVEAVQKAFQLSLNNFENMAQSADSQGKIFFAKEHAQWIADPAAINHYILKHDYQASLRLGIQVPTSKGAEECFSLNNFTIFPDTYLESWTVTFLIRHPALALPSFYRAAANLEKEGFAGHHEIQPLMELHSTLKWTRLLYDWCCERGTQSISAEQLDKCFPILLDAQDVIHCPEVVLKYCELIGMSPAEVKFAWDSAGSGNSQYDVPGVGPKTPEEVMMSTLNHSSCLIKEKTPATVDIALERGKWDVEFGESLAKQMEQWVREAMPDYNYLWAKRLQVSQRKK
ncbi:uncharacterized protein Aud_009505 [Aspergillus udagawae]|uniref:Uncharacterized protein n=1 Tax=Aspergillus udagawae TaxID=91492 RepID=A0A8E0V3V1_9EURO|nr:uncharacterized protein Aud_009505 [Aspergillus udagawae]GIC93026.1 hypothetical protein Aud_009505 [Aspergillus udagawae]